MKRKFTKINGFIRVALMLLFILNFSQSKAQCYSQPNYCIPSTTNVAGYSIGLQNVTLGSAVNNSTTATGNSPNYFDYTHMAVSGVPGTVINFSIKNGTGNSTRGRIFIDWDLDGTFSTSAPELVWTSPTTTANAVVSDTFSIPVGTAAGVYRIRVTGDFGGGSSPNPCSTGYGEQEDYSLVVTSSTKDGLAYAHVSPTSFYVGNDTIRFSMFNLTDTNMTSVDIGYQLDNNAAVTQSLSGLNIAADSMYTAKFDTLLNISTAGTYTIKVWLNNVNGGGTQTANNDTICRTFVICTTPLSGSYTIDSNGSGSTNFLTFNDAVVKLTNCGISGPVVFNIAADTFNEQISIPLISGTSSTNTITFEGVDTTSTMLTYDGVAGAAHTVLLKGSQYINFRNMRIRASGVTYAVAMFLSNANNNTVRSCVLELNKATTSNNSAGVVFSGSKTAFAGTSNCNNNYIDSNRITGGYYNITHAGNNGSVVNYIRRNKLQNAYYYGIYQNSSSISTNKIIGNTFELATGNSNSSCIYLINGTPSSGYFHEIKENIFLRTGQYHIYILTSQGGPNVNTSGEIFNNFFGGAFNNTNTAGCINMYGQNWKIYHNSFYMTGTATNSFCFSVYGGTNSIDFRNNILANAQTGGANYAADINNNNAISAFDNNILYSTNSNVMRIGGTNYQASNLSAAAYPNGAGISSFFEVPAFVSNTDLHIKNVCNDGVNLSVNSDIDGQTRNNPPDIGADENTSAPQTDIAVMQLLTPIFPVSAGSQPLSVLIKNSGSDSVSSLKVYYKLNGNAADSETFTFSPALQICDTATVTFTNNITIGSGANNIKVYTARAGDSFYWNDTVQKTFCVVMSGNYTINSKNSASTTNFISFKSAVSQLMCSGINGAVVFDVSADTFTEQVEIGVVNGVSSTNTITFIGHGVDSTILTFSGSAAAPHTLRLSSSKYVTFRDMGIQASSGSNAWAVNILNSSFNKFAKCKIECSGSAATATGTNFAALVINGNATTINSAGSNDANYIDSNIIIGGYYGIHSNSNIASSITYIRNNDISNAYYAGIYATSSHAEKILNNKVQNRSGSANNSAGIYIYNSNATSNVSGAYYEVKGNFINNVGQYGIFIQYVYGGNVARGELFNNMVGGNFTSTGIVYGIHINQGYYWNYFHNTVSIATATGSSHRALYVTGYMLRTQFKNNTFAINNAKAVNAVAMEITGNSTLPDSVNYNNYYNAADTSLVLLGAKSYNTTNYQVAYPSGGGGQSVDGDPYHYSASDLHASGTQLDNRGDALGVSVDIDDDSRSSTTPDIGADEYNAKTLQDFSLNKLLSPVAVACLGGYNQTISVSIKNMGIDTIDLTKDTAWVAAEVTDPNSNIITYGPVAVTGSKFNPKDAMTIDITNKFDMSDIGTYYIRPYISYHNDSNGFNDTLQNLSFDETNPVPILSFLPTTSICANDSIKLSGVDSKNTSDFQWYFNGSPVSGATDSVFYATQAGDYYLNVADNYYSGCDLNSDTITIKVGTAPTAAFSVGQITFCQGDSSALTAQGGSANNYQWLFNNTVIQGATDSIYYAKTSGTYMVVVQDKASGCAALSSSSKLTVYSRPTANVSYIGTGIKCMGDSLKLSTTPGSGLTYQWWMNATSINGATDSVYYAKATGNYQVSITNTNGCLTASAAANIIIDSLPNASVTLKGNPTACGMDTVYIDAINNASYTYEWMQNGNVISGAVASSLTVFTNGSYSVKVTNANGCKSTSTAVVVAYKPIPTIPTLNGNASSTICPGDSMRVSVSPQDTGSFTYQWKLNGNNISTGTDSFLYISGAGTYTAEVINNGGCTATSSSSISLSLHTAPSPSLTAAGSSTVCNGDSVSLTATNTNTGLSSVSWMLNTNVLTTTANPIFVKASGPYTAKITDNNGCKATTAAVNVFVNPLPVPTITQDIPNNELSTTAFSTYQWYKNGVAITGATTQKLKVYSNGDYTVEVTDANGCKGMSVKSTVVWGGVIATTNNLLVKVYPNPSQGVFNIEMPAGVEVKQLYITDIAGKQIVVTVSYLNKNIYTVDLSDKAAGVYILHLAKGEQSSTVRLIKY
ncbi:MAG: GEVED domain-containing protein [Bacteroidota bacterium]|nr:GEVED domain-containing protein [Bacteroidota bacterium]